MDHKQTIEGGVILSLRRWMGGGEEGKRKKGRREAEEEVYMYTIHRRNTCPLAL